MTAPEKEMKILKLLEKQRKGVINFDDFVYLSGLDVQAANARIQSYNYEQTYFTFRPGEYIKNYGKMKLKNGSICVAALSFDNHILGKYSLQEQTSHQIILELEDKMYRAALTAVEDSKGKEINKDFMRIRFKWEELSRIIKMLYGYPEEIKNNLRAKELSFRKANTTNVNTWQKEIRELSTLLAEKSSSARIREYIYKRDGRKGY